MAFRTQRGLGYSVTGRPTISVIEDTDTGLDWSAADTIDVLCGGTVVHSFTTGAAADLFNIVGSALTTGTGIELDDLNALTSGIGLHLASSATAITGAGRLLFSNHTGATGTSAILNEFKSAANDETVILKVTASDVNALGIALQVSTATTTGNGIDVTANALTTGIGIKVSSSAATTQLTGAGRLLRVDHTGNASGSGIIAEFASAAADETVILKVTASAALAAGVALQVSGAAVTTGTAIQASDLNALTSGIGLHLASSATAITGAGRLAYINHTGATSTSGILAEIASAATDETVMLKLTASGLLAAGKILHVSGATMTTGKAIDMPDLDGLTTGQAINIASNSSDTGTRALVKINNDNTAATGATPLEINNDATAGAHIKLTGTGILGIDFTALGATDFLWDCTAASGCTAAPQTNAPTGFITCKVGGTQQWIPYYNAT